MKDTQKRLVVSLILILLGILLAICCTGCFGRGGNPVVVTGGSVTIGEDGVVVTLPPGSLLPGEIKVEAGEEEDTYNPPKEEKDTSFPVWTFVTWLIPGAAACVALLLFHLKPMIPIAAGAGIILAVAMSMQMRFWDIIWSLVFMLVLVIVVVGVMLFKKSKVFKNLVTGIETARKDDPDLMDKMKKVEVDEATAIAVDKIKEKLK